MKKHTIAFHFLTIIFALSMTASGLAKITGQQALVQATTDLGYPIYLLNILGIAYLVGVIAIIQPKFKSLKQWGYAGFTIALLGAASSHLLAGQAFSTAIPALVLLSVLTVIVLLNKRLERA